MKINNLKINRCINVSLIFKINLIVLIFSFNSHCSFAFRNNKILFFGDGSSKCKDMLVSENAYFEEGIHPSAADMSELSCLHYKNKEFEDVAYFEPFYLKDFITGVKK